MIERRRPGVGYRHLLIKRDVFAFLGLLPDWLELSRGLRTVQLAAGGSSMGWHCPGNVAICAWEREIHGEWDAGFVSEHATVLERLSVPTTPVSDETVYVHWTESTAKGFQLMHVLLHELGHHRDRMTTRSKAGTARGEDYAEHYAAAYADRIWRSYFEVFGW